MARSRAGERRATRRVVTWLIALVAVTGCHRRPDIVPPSRSDSLGASTDSGTALLQALAERWDDPDGTESAAQLTGRAVLEDLRAHVRTEPRLVWADRTRALLDSLGVGAELAGAPCVMAANYFARANPGAGSWPWLYWCGENDLQAQRIEGGGMTLLAVAGRGLYGEPPRPPGPPGMAVLLGRRGATGQQPVLDVYRLDADGLDLAQSLGPDSLGGFGTGAFQTVGDTVFLVTRTFRPAPRFEECPTCPHVERVRRFRWSARGFERVSDATVASPYATFVMFQMALMANDTTAANARVVDPALVDAARRAGWAEARGAWRVAPQTDPRAGDITFFRGSTEAWHVRFQRRGDDWVMAAFEPTSRNLE